MITESYSASCYIENTDGQYHMECDVQTDDREIYSEYNGDNFITGLNTLMDDLQKQMFTEPEKPKEMSLEEKVEYLEGLVDDLRNEKADLVNQINKLTTSNKKDENKTNDLADYLKNLYKDIYGTNNGFSEFIVNF